MAALDTARLAEVFKELRDCFILLRRDYNTYTELYKEESRELLICGFHFL